MHIKGFLHKLLSSVMHKKRFDTLNILGAALLTSKKLSLTGLGRNIASRIQERSCIRRVDRFLGNKKLKNELKLIYEKNVEQIAGNLKRPKIIVDWSQVPNTKHYLLRAALALEGRALVLYEEVHAESNLGNEKIHNQFLRTLKELLPSKDCKAIIITDAGFYNAWFLQVLKLEWDFVGRIRGGHTYFDGENWNKCRDLYLQATINPKSINNVLLCKKRSVDVDLFFIKENAKKSSGSYKKRRGGGKDIFHYRRSAQDPWVLASSIRGKSWINIKKIIKLYKLRMQIEEGFRDLKYGFDLRHAYSKIKERVQILLLIAMLATLMASIIGYIAERKQWHYKFQTNSLRSRRVLSWFFLGCQVIKRNTRIKLKDLDDALHEMQILV